MGKFLILYKSKQSASGLMTSATPEQMKISMGEWMSWKENLDIAIGFEWGLPLQISSEVTPNGVEKGQSPVSGYAIMTGEKSAIEGVLKSHPHLKRDGSSIDVLEMMPMPGMQKQTS